MLIEDIDVSADPEITLACAKRHAENGFKTETVFTDMEQLSKFVDEDVFSILHLDYRVRMVETLAKTL